MPKIEILYQQFAIAAFSFSKVFADVLIWHELKHSVILLSIKTENVIAMQGMEAKQGLESQSLLLLKSLCNGLVVPTALFIDCKNCAQTLILRKNFGKILTNGRSAINTMQHFLRTQGIGQFLVSPFVRGGDAAAAWMAGYGTGNFQRRSTGH